MKNLFYVLICLTTLFTACDKTEDVEEVKVQMIFAETQCANPWEALPISDNYLAEVKSYLESQDLTVYTIKVERIYDGPLYGACSILSGRRITVSIPEPDIEKAEVIGFKTI